MHVLLSTSSVHMVAKLFRLWNHLLAHGAAVWIISAKLLPVPFRSVPFRSGFYTFPVWQHIGMGLSFRTIARNVNVSLGTVSSL